MPESNSTRPRPQTLSQALSAEQVGETGVYQTLVIGYGNTLRGDDGVGYVIAEAIAAWNLPGVEARACHQLTPELAMTIAQAKQVIFVDAAIAPPNAEPAIALVELEPDTTAAFTTHAASPTALLALTQWLYQKQPRAYQLTIPAIVFDFGECLSQTTAIGKTLALGTVQSLCQAVPLDSSCVGGTAHA